MRLFYSLPLIALLTAVASLNANAASFDCAKASTVVEGSVCANANLSKLDEALFDVYFRATLTRPADKQELMAEQRSWLGLRNNCGANVDCLTTAYQKRIEHLEKSLVPKATNNAIQALNGNWYSSQWKYGYVLQNGVGTATSTNSPNFQIGQNILQLTQQAPNKFTGQQVYTDGKFYKVTATLQQDGSLAFEGEKNAKWTMTRVGGQSTATLMTESYQDGRAAVDAKDYASALRIFNALSKINDARAQNYLGIMYATGRGVNKDEAQAMKWYQLAAENGFAAAQFNLGTRYRQGVGAEQNFDEALKWLRLSASKFNASAQFELGLMYQMGQGVATNNAEAIKWYQLAAAQGHKQAKNNLDVLRPAVAVAQPAPMAPAPITAPTFQSPPNNKYTKNQNPLMAAAFTWDNDDFVECALGTNNLMAQGIRENWNILKISNYSKIMGTIRIIKERENILSAQEYDRLSQIKTTMLRAGEPYSKSNEWMMSCFAKADAATKKVTSQTPAPSAPIPLNPTNPTLGSNTNSTHVTSGTSQKNKSLLATALSLPSNIKNPVSTTTNVNINNQPKGDFEITLENKKNGSGDFCYLVYQVKNNTDINFTSIQFEIIYRDKKSIILGKSLLWNGVRPRDTKVIEKAVDQCSEHTSVEIVSPAANYQIDGDTITNKEKLKNLDSLRIVSGSRIPEITMKSKGGEIKLETKSASSLNQTNSTLKPSSGKNEPLDATPESCSKVTDLIPQYKEAIAQRYSVAMSSIRYVRNQGCMATVDTAAGPKQCGIGGVLWLSTGEYLALNAVVINSKFKSSFGGVGCL